MDKTVRRYLGGGESGGLRLRHSDSKGMRSLEESEALHGKDKLPVNHETHLHDLPEECLLEIMRRVASVSLPPPRTKRRETVVQHPLHFALVCRRWRALVPHAVSTLSFSNTRLNLLLAQHIGNRFKHLTSLSFCPLHADSGPALLFLSSLTPELQHLELKGKWESPFPEVAQALSTWTNIRKLNFGTHSFSLTDGLMELKLDFLSSLPSLRHLSFGYRHLNHLAVESRIELLTGLTSLELSCVSPPATSPLLCQILRKLEIGWCLYSRDARPKLPDSLAHLKSLEELCVNNFMEQSLPPALCDLSQLTSLVLSQCENLTFLPDAISQLSALRSLHVKNCSAMWRWPEYGLSSLHSLRTLVISRCRALPLRLGPISNLRVLHIESYESLPDDIGELPHLDELELGMGNGTVVLPASLFRLSLLRTLCLRNFWWISVLPTALGRLATLTELHLADCGTRLESLPENLGALARLGCCRISGFPRLRLLPESVYKWRELTSLEISRCAALRELPEGILCLVALKELEIEACASLVSLPRGIGKLRCLQVLCVRSCESLTELPEGIEHLPEMRLLQLQQCKLLEPPAFRHRAGFRIDYS